MNTDPKKPLNDILTIVGYQGDKELFIEQFVQLCIQKALVSMIKKLTDEQQDVLLAKLSATNDPTAHRTLIGAYFSQEYINYEMTRSTEMMLFDYLEAVIPHLTQEQKQQLDNYLKGMRATKQG